MEQGKLTLIWGGMFSGKTEEMIRRIRREIIAGKNAIVFKPTMDKRGSKDLVESHNGRAIQAVRVLDSREILCVIVTEMFNRKLDVVGIDEVQFFDIGLISVIEVLMKNGVDVICSGLDMDYKGEAFLVTKELAPISNECVKLNAVCVDCGKDAYISHRTVNQEGKVVIGGKDKYVALCKDCNSRRLDKTYR